MREFEREFFTLAGAMLSCRLRCLGVDIERDESIPPQRDGDWQYALIGYIDQCGEMQMLCTEMRNRP